MDFQLQQLYQQQRPRRPPQQNQGPRNIQGGFPSRGQQQFQNPRQFNNQFNANNMNPPQNKQFNQNRRQFPQNKQQQNYQQPQSQYQQPKQFYNNNINNRNDFNQNQPQQFRRSPSGQRQTNNNNSYRGQNPSQQRFNKSSYSPQQRYQDNKQSNQRNNQQQFNQQQQQRQPNFPPPPPNRQQRQRQAYTQRSSKQQRYTQNKQFQPQEQQQFPRGRGRGRGSRGGPNFRGRSSGQNQHQRPYNSQLDNKKNSQRMQKFKPQQKPKYIEKKKNQKFIKQDEQLISNEISEESQNSYTGEDEYTGSEQEGSYSEYTNSQENQQEYSNDNEKGSLSQLSQRQQQQEQNQKQSEQSQQTDNKKAIKLNNIIKKLASNHEIATMSIDQMCSKQQFRQRLQTFQMNNKQNDISKMKLDTSRSFSIFEINKRTMKPDYQLALKRFKRSADRAQGQDEQDTKDCRRSIKALVKVINHINRQIIDADHLKQKDLAFPKPPGQNRFQFIHIYDFLWDRMREIIKDITRLSEEEKLTKEIITISEQIARFFILSINQGRKKYKSRLKFDQRMNTESILKVISNLMHLYRQSRLRLKNLIQNISEKDRKGITIQKIQKMMEKQGIYVSPYQPQISAYSLLFSDNRKKQFYQILSSGFQDHQTQSQNPLINSQQMQKALNIHRILNQRNIQQYFHQLQSQQTDYLFSCIILKHLQSMRRQTSKMLFKTHYFEKNGQTTKNSLLADYLRKTLRFHQSQRNQFQQFLDMLGVSINGRTLIWVDNLLDQDLYIIPEYIFSKNKLERKKWTDSECQKKILNSNQLSRQELVKSSWKNSTYTKKVINFYMGNLQQLLEPIVVPKILKKIQKTNKINADQRQKSPQPEVNTSCTPSVPKENKNLSLLNQKRKQIIKQKRTRFLQKLQHQITQLYKHTDQAKNLNRKKGLIIIDEWTMFYQDRNLKIALNYIQAEANKKNLLTNVLRQIKSFAGVKKRFNDCFNKKNYEFSPTNEKLTNPIIKYVKSPGSMSYFLNKAHLKAKKVYYQNFEQFLQSENQFNTSFIRKKNVSLMFLSTIPLNPSHQKVISDIINYFIFEKEIDQSYKHKQIKQAIKKLSSKQKYVSNIKVNFSTENLVLNIKIAQVNDVKNIKKAITQNSHIIQNLFGCHGLFILRENSKSHSTQMILQTLQQFMDNKSKFQKTLDSLTNNSTSQKQIQVLVKLQLPILMINIIKKSSQQHQDQVKNLLSADRYTYLKNILQVTILQSQSQSLQSTLTTIKIPFILKQNLNKFLLFIQEYSNKIIQIEADLKGLCYNYNQIVGENNQNQFNQNSQTALSDKNSKALDEENVSIRTLGDLLKEIKINSSYLQEKLQQRFSNNHPQQKKQFIFAFYQQYFNLCLQKISQQLSKCYKNSIFIKKWSKFMLLSQKILNPQDLKKKKDITNLKSRSKHLISQQEQDQLIKNLIQSQANYNIISQTFKQYDFLHTFINQLKMNIVGEYIEKLETKYLIFDEYGQNIFGEQSKSVLNILNQKKLPRKQQIEKELQLTHFINVISKYLNLFDNKNNFSDDKFQTLQSLFLEYGLQLKLFETIKNKSTVQPKQTTANYQIQGDSHEFFIYLINYLIEGTKNITLILPKNFRFKISFQQFIKRSMSNLNIVLKTIKQPKKRLFEQSQTLTNLLNLYELRKRTIPTSCFSQIRLINQDDLQIKQLLESHNQTRQFITISDSIEHQPHELISIQSQSSIIDVDKNQSEQSKSMKRNQTYNFGTIYKHYKSQFKYCRAQMLNQIRKKIKI